MVSYSGLKVNKISLFSPRNLHKNGINKNGRKWLFFLPFSVSFQFSISLITSAISVEAGFEPI